MRHISLASPDSPSLAASWTLTLPQLPPCRPIPWGLSGLATWGWSINCQCLRNAQNPSSELRKRHCQTCQTLAPVSPSTNCRVSDSSERLGAFPAVLLSQMGLPTRFIGKGFNPVQLKWKTSLEDLNLKSIEQKNQSGKAVPKISYSYI